MLRNYLKIAFRSLWRSKAHSLINVLGLSLGIVCCILIALFVKDELTFDRFHSKSDRIYRVYAREDWGENQQFFNTVTPFPMGPTLKEIFPEVESQARLLNIGTQVKVGDDIFSEQATIAGENFFEIFDFEIKAGERNALHEQSAVVITRAMAQKYFGETNPIDKSISLQIGENFEEFTVKAVATDLPTNSSIQFKILISDLNFPKLIDHQTLTSAWFNINPETYVLLREGTSVADVESKFPSVFRTILGEEDYKQSKYAPGLQPLTDIHLNKDYPIGIAPVSDPKYSYILLAIAILILFVACINFVTLSIGRSMKRAREVGIRKVVGAARKQLIAQFIGEAVIVTVIALSLGILLSVLSLPVFNDLAGKQLVLVWNGFMALLILLLIVIIGLMAGSYPAFVLSSFKPIEILKGHISSGNNKQMVRKVLVGVQLVLSIFLVSSTLIMQQQLHFLQNKSLGFNKEQLAVVRINVNRDGRLTERIKKGFEQAEQFKVELGKIQGIAGICATSHDFGKGGWTSVGYTDDQGTYRNFSLNVVDDEYIPVMKMEMRWGRNFSDENPADARRSVLVNEAFAKEYGWTDPAGKRIPGKNFADHEVIGIVKDFHFSSLYTAVQPLVIVQDPAIILSGVENINIDNSPLPKLMLRLRAENMASTLDQVKNTWDVITGGEEFVFSFVDEALQAQYRSDLNLGRIVSIATLLAMVIGSLGLYALASLAMQNRTKEISIRKVMGATEQSLLVLLSKDYVLLIGLSLLLSVPITWYMMSTWLQSFQYRIEVSWKVFALAGGLSLMIALITISYQAIKTAWTRPAETLKYE